MTATLRKLKRVLGRIWFRLFELMNAPTGPRGSHIVLVRADGLGDLLYSLPLLESVRRSEAPKRTVLVCDAGAREFLARLRVADEFVSFSRAQYRKDPFYRWRVWKTLRTIGADVSVNLQYHRSPTSDELLLATGSPITLAMSGNDEMINERDRRRSDERISSVVDVPDHIPERSRYDRLAAQRKWDDVDWDRSYAATISRAASPSKDQNPGARRTIMLAPGGSSNIRRWPASHWSELIRRIADVPGLQPMLIGGRTDRPLVEAIASSAGISGSERIGRDVLEVSRLLTEAAVVVGLDAGISHLAARCGVPAVVILGGGHFSRYFPYGSAEICFAHQECYECNWRCHRNSVVCLEEISVDQVVKAIVTRLQTTGGSNGG